MELGVFWRSLRQRWYLVLALVVLTGAATFLVAERVGPTYEATGTALIFPPSETQGPGGDTTLENPYLSLGGVNQARDVLVRDLTSKSVGDEFGEEFPGTSFEVVPDYTNSAPIILFTVEAASSEDAVAALQMLMDRVPVKLSELQLGLELPPAEEVTSVALTRDERPTVTHKDQIRAAIMVAAVLGGAGLLLIALIDGLLAGRRRDAEADATEAAETIEVPETLEARPREAVPVPTTPPGDEPARPAEATAGGDEDTEPTDHAEPADATEPAKDPAEATDHAEDAEPTDATEPSQDPAAAGDAEAGTHDSEPTPTDPPGDRPTKRTRKRPRRQPATQVQDAEPVRATTRSAGPASTETIPIGPARDRSPTQPRKPPAQAHDADPAEAVTPPLSEERSPAGTRGGAS